MPRADFRKAKVEQHKKNLARIKKRALGKDPIVKISGGKK